MKYVHVPLAWLVPLGDGRWMFPFSKYEAIVAYTGHPSQFPAKRAIQPIREWSDYNKSEIAWAEELFWG